MKLSPPNLYAYTDYRQFLLDWVAYKRSNGPFSLRSFSIQAGFKAHNVLQQVINGRRKIAFGSVPKFAKALRLTEEQTEYFETLVVAGGSKTQNQQARVMKRILENPHRRLRRMKSGDMEFFRSWLTPVIYEMTRLRDFKADSDWIAAKLGGQISSESIGELVDRLIKSGLLNKKEGKLIPQSESLDSGDGVTDLDLFQYHETALAKAGDALLDANPQSSRFVVLTLALPTAAARKLLKMVDAFEAGVLELTNAEGPKTEVVQVGVQSFSILTASAKRVRSDASTNL